MDVDYGDQGYGASRARRGGGHRRDDPYGGGGGGGGGGGYDDYYDRRERGGPRGGRGRRGKPYDRRGGDDDDYTKHHQMEDPSGALTFRQFAFKHLPNDATPQEAEEKYEQYKIENAHLFHEQYFTRQKNDTWLQRTFDPRMLESNQGRRLELAKEQSEKFAKGFAETGTVEGLPDYSEATTETEADGGENMETEDPEKKAKKARRIGGFVPREAWHMDRLKHDLTISRSLIEKINGEKEIPNSPELANALQNNLAINDKSSAEDIAKAIDTCVVYLWNVHGVDYYGGRETNPHDYIEIAEGRNVKAKCSFRKPLSTFALGGGETAVPVDAPIDAIEANEIATKWSKRVDSNWSERLTCLSDPVVLRLVDDADLDNKIEEWIKAQVVVFDENRFGSTLSAKLFIAEEFVLKHIKTKQTEAIERERDRLVDEKYKENVFTYLRAEEAKGNKPTLRGLKRGGSGGGRVGGRGGRGRGRGRGRGPYTDLDATTNERVVIDYGEI